jgi:hypothetical protein
MAFGRVAGRPARLAAGALVIALGTAGLAACASNPNARTMQSQESDGGGFSLFRRKPAVTQTAATGIGVNAYLWRASLDTLSFMPMQSFDPFGGLIITDWYTNPEQPNERFKATVYVLDTRLRADGINVAIHRQQRQGAEWVDAATSPTTEEAIENAILTRARQIRTSGR